MINIQFILKLTFFISNFFLAACHYLLTCSDHGYCSDAGTCQCDKGFYGDSCSSKHNIFLQVFSFSSLSEISWFLTKACLNYIQLKRIQTNIAKKYHKNRIYLQKFLLFLHKWYQILWQHSNIFNIFFVSFISKKCRHLYF